MDWNNNRNTLILAFILLALGAVAFLESSAFVVLFLLGLLFLVRQFDQSQLSTNYRTGYEEDAGYAGEGEYEEDWEETTAPPRAQAQGQREPVYRHALEAVTRAGLDPDTVQVLAVDIGMMGFKGQETPTVYRTWSVPDDVEYVQPFVQLRLPSKARGKVRFEVLDASNKVVFVHENFYDLEKGRNFVSPAARLKIQDGNYTLGSGWQMRIIADDMLVATHRFEFDESTSANIQRHIGEDGEINAEMRSVMTENRLPKMSLDDLLSYQSEEDSNSQQRSR
jgi:hypothetical protein